MKAGELPAWAKNESFEVVDLKFCNLLGAWHHLTVPIKRLTFDLFERGVGIDGSSVPGFKLDGGSDLLIIPDPDTASQDRFWQRKTLSLICTVHETGSRMPFSLDPRNVAKKAERFLVKTGIADTSIWGPEYEFYVFDRVTFANEINVACYRIDSHEADWGRCENCAEDNSHTIPHKGGYHSAPPQDSSFLLRDRMCAAIQACGIEVKYHHHEVGGPGQSEIEVMPDLLLRSGDAAMMIKYICKMVARSEGCCVTFMPKPLYNEAGSGLHFHQHLLKGGKPVFYDGKGYAGLSKTALYYIGGLLYHGPALLAITSPSTNSYKRLVPGFEAPVKSIFGLGNRAAAVRIPKYADTPDKKRIEFRLPDATCNVYLAMAAQLLAGIDGIRKKMDPVKLGFGPFDTDVTKLPPEKSDLIASLPDSLSHSLDALEKDHQFLLEGDVFTEELLANWINWKRNKEIAEVNQRPHPYEMRLYFDA